MRISIFFLKPCGGKKQLHWSARISAKNGNRVFVHAETETLKLAQPSK